MAISSTQWLQLHIIPWFFSGKKKVVCMGKAVMARVRDASREKDGYQ